MLLLFYYLRDRRVLAIRATFLFLFFMHLLLSAARVCRILGDGWKVDLCKIL